MKRTVALILALTIAFALYGCGRCEHDFSAATCTAPATCKKCGETEGKPLGHDFSAATCTAPATCSRCGETKGEPLGHDWADATCTEPKTCLQCGVTSGESLGHKPDHAATCTEPSTCTVCGIVLEEAHGHQWEDATCIILKTCSVCGATEGDYAEHKFTEATCLAPKTCTVCGATEGEVSKEHTWIEATCTEPKTCSLCGKTEGRALGHDYSAATCEKPRTCKRCGATQGNPNGHRAGNWEVTVPATKDKAGTRIKKCMVCGKTVEEESFTLTDKELLQQYRKTSSINYNDLARNPDKYKDQYVFFTGRVVQVCSEAKSELYYSTYRVATQGRYNNVVFVYIDNYGSGSRILEGDTISFYGKFDGLYTYTTVMGASITIPSVKVEVYCQGEVY